MKWTISIRDTEVVPVVRTVCRYIDCYPLMVSPLAKPLAPSSMLQVASSKVYKSSRQAATYYYCLHEV